MSMQAVRHDASNKLAVATFIVSAASADVPLFVKSLGGLNFPGAWLEAFQQLQHVPAELITPAIPRSFMAAWRGTTDEWASERPLGINWTIGTDLDGQTETLVRALRLLMPPYSTGEVPTVLYRGQGRVPDGGVARW